MWTYQCQPWLWKSPRRRTPRHTARHHYVWWWRPLSQQPGRRSRNPHQTGQSWRCQLRPTRCKHNYKIVKSHRNKSHIVWKCATSEKLLNLKIEFVTRRLTSLQPNLTNWILRSLYLKSFHESLCARFGDGTKVIDQVGFSHADPGIDQGQGTCRYIRDDVDFQFLAVVQFGWVSQTFVTDFVQSLGAKAYLFWHLWARMHLTRCINAIKYQRTKL